MSLLDSLPPAERRAVALVGLMIHMHGGKDGDGLFAGVARYGVLEQRLRLAAERSVDVRQLWDTVARLMQWTIGPTARDGAALALIAPAPNDRDVLRAIADRAQSLVMIARSLARRDNAVARGEPKSDGPPPFDDPLDVFDQFHQSPPA